MNPSLPQPSSDHPVPGGGGSWMLGRQTVTEMTGPKFSLNRNGEGGGCCGDRPVSTRFRKGLRWIAWLGCGWDGVGTGKTGWGIKSWFCCWWEPSSSRILSQVFDQYYHLKISTIVTETEAPIVWGQVTRLWRLQ